MKIKDLKDFIDRECTVNLAIVISATEGKSSKGSKYLSLVLQDSTGTIDAKNGMFLQVRKLYLLLKK